MPILVALRFPGLLFALAVAFFGVHAAEKEAHARYRAVRARTDAQCAAYRLARNVDPCESPFVPGPRAVPTLREGKEAMTDARAALAAGKADDGLTALGRAVDVAVRLDRMGTLMGDAGATRLLGEVLDLVEGHQAVLDPARTLAVLERARISEASDPLAFERLYRASLVLATPDGLRVGRWVGEAYAADTTARYALTLDEMGRAAKEGDLRRCQRAADANGAYAALETDHFLCKHAVGAVETQRRLEAVRAGLARAARA